MLGPEEELRAAEAEFQADRNDVADPSPTDPVPNESVATTQAPAQSQDDPIDQQPRKKLKLTEADKKRSVRMFGALMGTLSKFQHETSKTKQTDAAKRRAAVENRLQAKLKVESEALHQLRAFELEEKNLKQSTWRKAEELGHLSALNPIRFANRLAFSHYLRTTSSSNLKQTDQTDPPSSAHARSRNQDPLIYWLPHKLLPEQKDLIESQRRAAREEIEEGQRIWEEDKRRKQEELEQLQIAQDVRFAEIENEKAHSRLVAGSTMPAPDAPSTEDVTITKVGDGHEATTRDTSHVRQDTPEVSNDNGRDEDAVEY